MTEEFELESWDNGKPISKNTNKEVIEKIRRLREKKDFKGIL
jgi:ribulose bisphosphate carboxylase small subunit